METFVAVALAFGLPGISGVSVAQDAALKSDDVTAMRQGDGVNGKPYGTDEGGGDVWSGCQNPAAALSE